LSWTTELATPQSYFKLRQYIEQQAKYAQLKVVFIGLTVCLQHLLEVCQYAVEIALAHEDL
jgi:hypothetical protein